MSESEEGIINIQELINYLILSSIVCLIFVNIKHIYIFCKSYLKESYYENTIHPIKDIETNNLHTGNQPVMN